MDRVGVCWPEHCPETGTAVSSVWLNETASLNETAIVYTEDGRLDVYLQSGTEERQSRKRGCRNQLTNHQSRVCCHKQTMLDTW